MTDRPGDTIGEGELVDRIKQLRAERKRYFDVEGDGVDVLLCDIQSYFDARARTASSTREGLS